MNGHRIGYVRVSSFDQNPERQLEHVQVDRLDTLRLIVQKLTKLGVRIEFVKENLTFTGEDSPLANLMLSVMGDFAEFERALIRERQRESSQCLSRVKHSRCGSRSREVQMCVDMIPHCITTATRSYGAAAARLKSGVLESASAPTRSSND